MSGTHVTSKQVAPTPSISQGRRYLNGALSGVVEVMRSNSLLAKINSKCNSFFFDILLNFPGDNFNVSILVCLVSQKIPNR
jgi:hypothetical protein